jgi:hypothetical protein
MIDQNSKVKVASQLTVASAPSQPLWVQVTPETAAIVKGGPLFR